MTRAERRFKDAIPTAAAILREHENPIVKKIAREHKLSNRPDAARLGKAINALLVHPDPTSREAGVQALGQLALVRTRAKNVAKLGELARADPHSGVRQTAQFELWRSWIYHESAQATRLMKEASRRETNPGNKQTLRANLELIRDSKKERKND